MPQLVWGTVFANAFRVVRSLSEGGMGAVYVVEQLATGMERALKVMHPELVSDPRLRERFAQEARIGSRIRSDHVVQVLDAGVDAERGMPWILMELLRGETLAQLVARTGPIPPAVVRLIFGQLCHAIAAAHEVSIVHRDLKPENIFLEVPRREGVDLTVKVLDFGIAKVIAEANTRHTQAIGTPLWMAPEQTEERSVIAPTTDVWALGLIAFKLLTGRSYWRQADSPMGLMREVVLEPLVPASERAASFGLGHLVPAGFDAFFARCVAREPGARFANASELRKHLDAALGASRGSPPLPPTDIAQPTMPMPAVHEISLPPPAPPRVWMLVALGALLAVGATAALVIRGAPEPTAPAVKPAPLKPKPKPAESEGAAEKPLSAIPTIPHSPEATSSAKPITSPTPAPTPSPSSPPTGQPFDRVSAKNALASVKYKDCGTGGPGKVLVVFAPSGSTTMVAVVSGDHNDATKSCVARRFREAKVSPFEGSPVSITYSISL